MMNLKLILPVLIIGIIFISGCNQEPTKSKGDEMVTQSMDTNPSDDQSTQEISESQIKTIVYNAIKNYFPEIARTSSIEDFKHQNLNKRCGKEWFFDVENNLLAPYPRIQVCSEGEAYTLDELYTAYEEAVDMYREQYKDDETMKDAVYQVNRENLAKGDVVSFKIINNERCENGITLRFPCKGKYVIELIITYSCNDLNTESRTRNIANEILSYC